MGTPFLNTNNDYDQTLTWFGKVPGRVDAIRAAALLGFSENDIPILIAHNVLKPLGKPAPNAIKYFSTCDIQRLACDREWLAKATQCVYEHWRGKNAQKAAQKEVMPLAA